MAKNSSLLVRLLAIFVALVWMLFVTTNYYIVHKPFAAENAVAILNTLGDILITVLLLVLAAAIGRRILRSLDFSSSLEAIVFQTGLGCGILSFATLGLGLVGLLYPLPFWSLLLLALLVLRREVGAAARHLRSIALPKESQFERWLALFCAVTLVIAFFYALTPPTGWDAQTYHLVEAKRAVSLGRIAPPPDIVYFSFPSLVEMLFLAGMVLKGDGVAQLIHLGFLLLALGLLFSLAHRYFDSRVAWLACSLLLAVPSFVAVSTWAYVDIALVYFALASLYALLIARQATVREWYVLAGAYAGLAAGVKYTGAIVALAVLILLVRARVADIAVHLVAVALFAAPWYLRNLAFTGNPFYPFVFGGAYWDSFRGEWFSRFGTGLLNTPWQLVTAPWDATVLGTEGGLAYGATIGPILLTMIPLLLFTFHALSGDERNRLRDILLFSAILFVFWLVGIAGSKLLLQTRLLFAAFPMFALCAAVAFDCLAALDLKQFSLQRFTRLVLILGLGLTAFSYLLNFASNNSFRYLSGAESRDGFLGRQLGDYYTAVQFINKQLRPGDKVLFLWEPRTYYVQQAVQPDVILDTLPHLRWQYHNADSIVAALRALGYTHVLLDRQGLNYLLQSGYDPITMDDLEILQGMQPHLNQVYGRIPFDIGSRQGMPAVTGADQDRYAIYEIAEAAAAQK